MLSYLIIDLTALGLAIIGLALLWYTGTESQQ
jgi:hypothetical protein